MPCPTLPRVCSSLQPLSFDRALSTCPLVADGAEPEKQQAPGVEGEAPVLGPLALQEAVEAEVLSQSVP